MLTRLRLKQAFGRLSAAPTTAASSSCSTR